ncbi:MAG: peptidylprolyl isomerase [Deltaproteobacteria bacterium]|nr:peptidylprolyl isomerase [Deltaproteobacteria bacterium]
MMNGRKSRSSIALAVGASLVWALVGPSWADEKKPAAAGVIADGKQVSLEFTLSLDDKTQVQSNVGKEPLVYTHGAHQIVPGLEKNLVGLKAGETKHVEVSPDEGYGQVDPKRTQEVEVDKIPEGARKVGSKLTGRAPNGQMMFAEVKEIKDKTVVLDMNHPLAGKKLIFDVKVLKVEGAPKVEAPAPAPAAAAPAPAQAEKK